MPSSTFFNLPAQKREKLLQAARAEFGRVAYADASVNKIIQAAGIPRGSFYMYFEDKEELFLYLMEEYGRQLEEMMDGLLEAVEGDLFAAFLALFDLVGERWRRGEYLELVQILRHNGQMKPNIFLQREGPGPLLQRLRDKVDLSRLTLQEEADLEDILHLLVFVTGGALMAAGQSGDSAAARERLVHIIEILKHGAARTPAEFGEA